MTSNADQAALSVSPDEFRTGPAVTAPLSYARLLYADGVRYRSRLGAALVSIFVAVAAGCGAVVADLHGDLPAGGRLAFATGSFVAAAAAAALLAGMVADRREGFELTTAGVRTSRGLVPWHQVTRVVAGGTPDGSAVRLFFAHRRTPAADAAVATVQLSTTRRVTPAEYESLSDLLRREVSPAYPHVEVGRYELPRHVARSSASRTG